MKSYARSLALVALAAACTGRDHDGGSADKRAAPVAGGADPWARAEQTIDLAPPAELEKEEAVAFGGLVDDMEDGRGAKNKRRDRSVGGGGAMARPTLAAAPAPEPMPDQKAADGDDDGNVGGGESATRSWFPETFLFQPLVVTDASGAATVPVKVPDRLTTWRVLALAHSRTGAQGGATASFLGTLDTYVDLVVPPFLIVGDEIKLPIQAVNTTASPVATVLAVEAKHATLAGVGGARTLPAEGSLVEYATLKATRAGRIEVSAGLRGTDAVLRTIDVLPAGRPVTQTRSGTLAAPRTLTIEGPAGADPTTSRVRLLVYPGALALLRSELGVSTARGGVADDAYALLLAGKASALLAALGDTADPAALRELAIVAGQRAIRHARTLDVTRAALLAEAALAHADNPVLARLGERAVAHLAQHQRPDGTFAGGAGWTLQRVLAATAEATAAVRSSAAVASAGRRLRPLPPLPAPPTRPARSPCWRARAPRSSATTRRSTTRTPRRRCWRPAP